MYINYGDIMKIYLDFVFLINFFFDFLLLFGTSKILKKIISLKRLLLGSGFGTLTILLLFLPLNSILLFLLKVLMSIFIIVITFGKKDIIKNLTYFYLLSIILGGTMYLFDITFNYKNTGLVFIKNPYYFNFLLLIIISPIIVSFYIKEQVSYKTTISNKYIIEIYLNNIKYNLEAVLDTGNTLTDPYKKRPIILVDISIAPERKRVIYVPYKALNTEGVIPCILPDKVIINEKEFKNCLIGLSKDKFSLNGVNCILPNKFKEDLC